jgi:hypothetical protein
MYVGLLVVRETKNIVNLWVALLVWALLVCMLLFHFRWAIFGYRVITNYRAALVIPERRYPLIVVHQSINSLTCITMLVCGPATRSSFFTPTLKQLLLHEYLNGGAKFHTVSINYLACLKYENDSVGGSVDIYGVTQVLHFGYVEHIKLLDSIYISISFQNMLT